MCALKLYIKKTNKKAENPTLVTRREKLPRDRSQPPPAQVTPQRVGEPQAEGLHAGQIAQPGGEDACPFASSSFTHYNVLIRIQSVTHTVNLRDRGSRSVASASAPSVRKEKGNAKRKRTNN